jgi:hypothetical protein
MSDLSSLLAHLRGLLANAYGNLPHNNAGEWHADGSAKQANAMLARGGKLMAMFIGGEDVSREQAADTAIAVAALLNAAPLLLSEMERLEEARRSGALDVAVIFFEDGPMWQAREGGFVDVAPEYLAVLRSLAAGEGE